MAVDWMLKTLLPSRSSGSGEDIVHLGVLGREREGVPQKGQFTSTVVEGVVNQRPLSCVRGRQRLVRNANSWAPPGTH